jgi:16S rRNA (guanine966-N2)-methyltransferase
VEVHTSAVAVFLDRATPVAADLVFLDPPYAYDGLGADLRALVTRGWLAPGATVVVERASRTGRPALPPELGAVVERRYGETTLWLSRLADDGD